MASGRLAGRHVPTIRRPRSRTELQRECQLAQGNHNIRFGFDSDFQDSNEMQYEMTGSSYNTSAGGFHFAQGTTQLKGGPSGNDFNAFASFLLGLPQDSQDLSVPG